MIEADLMAIMHRAYVGSLVFVCLFAAFRGVADLRRLWSFFVSVPMRRTAAVLLVNWCVNTAFVLASGIFDPWPWFIAIDALSAAAVLYQPAGKPQSVIGGLYMAQIIIHGVYGALEVSGGPIAENSYWQILTALAFVQLIVLGVWSSGYHGGRLVRHFGVRRRSQVARPHGGRGMAR